MRIRSGPATVSGEIPRTKERTGSSPATGLTKPGKAAGKDRQSRKPGDLPRAREPGWLFSQGSSRKERGK